MKIALLFLAALCSTCLCFSEIGNQMPEECCFNFIKKIPINRLKDYRVTNNQCSHRAVIFLTQKGRNICAAFHDEWVQKAIKSLDAKKPRKL
nr:PREDICTED: C-C motif chemokine 3-like [Latimeria chalumnae]|eukprot:XP_014342833.1 PREDICTED: C-C motif chemokine 3-like [Latimeria chalumnae]